MNLLSIWTGVASMIAGFIMGAVAVALNVPGVTQAFAKATIVIDRALM